MRGGSEVAEVQYLVLPDNGDPYLLARVRWPDVAQAISEGRPEWQGDPGLFDLPYDPGSATVTRAQAASIAARWGANLPLETEDPAISLIRRMPANWSNLVPAEKRAWSLELVAGRHASASRTRRSRSFFGSRSRRSALEPASRSAASPGVIGSEVVFGESRHLVTNGNGSTAEAAERRRHARMHVRGQALIRIARKTVSANLVNVSEGGMHCVVHDAESVLESGGRLESPLVLEDAGAESQVSLDVVANVSWHKAAGPGTRLGLFSPSWPTSKQNNCNDFSVTAGTEQVLRHAPAFY